MPAGTLATQQGCAVRGAPEPGGCSPSAGAAAVATLLGDGGDSIDRRRPQDAAARALRPVVRVFCQPNRGASVKPGGRAPPGCSPRGAHFHDDPRRTEMNKSLAALILSAFAAVALNAQATTPAPAKAEAAKPAASAPKKEAHKKEEKKAEPKKEEAKK